MPSWGRPSGAQDAGRYLEGAKDDVYRFQELNSDDEKNGVSLDHGSNQVSNGKQLHNPDDLYFNDMDIRAWERRSSALEGSPYDVGYDMQEEDEGYYDDAGEPVSRAEYEELLFSRVLDKIRVARAVGNPDVQLSPEELEAYQSRLYGARSPTTRSQPKSPRMDDTASVHSVNTSRPGHSSSSKSKSKKGEPRSSLFSSKPKKEKRSERHRTVSNVSSGSSQIAPGFVIPGPDGQRIYTPINAYQGSLARDPDHRSQPGSRSVSGSSQAHGGYPHSIAPSEIARDIPGAFSGFATPAHSYRSTSPPRQGRSTTLQQSTQESNGSRVRSPSIQTANLVPFPIEPYQYQSFSPTSSSSQPSPQLQYTRRPSAPASEASYTSMPRRVPVPGQPAIAVGNSHFDASPTQASYPSPAVEVVPEPVSVQPAKASGSGKDGERRRKGGKSKKRT
ncbi:hypothetical protein HBI40_060220 [Parastagonospora nodorum]|nr:hypothetical protein HBI11_101070 [Parastagonospora nodorum]KAH5766586.1 hypothetical protein HBI17_036200 [Parastagonospora nodorum]KAH6258586.1 hypothetical protein HBI41_145910 [Parastagonospora nodorum]KAH6295699.1 hypothetical protein HBI40_060220 [Parastagonospora nodorum]